MRILALVTEAFGASGGIAEYNRQILSGLACKDDIEDVVVLPRRGGPPPQDLPPRVRQLRPQLGRVGYAIGALRTAANLHPINLVFCGHLYMAPLAAAVAVFFRAPLWIQIHGIEAWTRLPLPYRRSLERAILVTSGSRYTRRRVLEWSDIDPIRVKVLPCTVDPRFGPGPKPHYLLDRHQLRGKQVLMTVSRLESSERYKGQDRVIKILPRLLRDHPEAVYLIVGDGNDRPRLDEIARDMGVTERVHFVGFVPAAELPDYLRLADVYVMPSTGEGFGIAFLEAMASGLSVIGGNRDGSVDPLGDGTLGTLIDPESEVELAGAIRAALDHPSRDAARAGRFARPLFAQHLDRVLSPILTDIRGGVASEAGHV